MSIAGDFAKNRKEGSLVLDFQTARLSASLPPSTVKQE